MRARLARETVRTPPEMEGTTQLNDGPWAKNYCACPNPGKILRRLLPRSHPKYKYEKDMIGERLLAARRMRGLGQGELAAMLGGRYDRSMISKVERGRSNLLLDGLIHAAQALDVSTDFLVGLTDDPRPADERLSPLEPANSVLVGTDIEVLGIPRDVSPISKGGLPFSRTWLEEHQVDPSVARVYQVNGHVMHPTIHSNAAILVDYGRKDLSHGSIYLVKRPNSVRIGRAYLDDEGWWLFNRASGHMDDVAPLEKEDEIRGQVCWTARNLLQSSERSKSL